MGHGFNGDYALDGKVRLIIDGQVIPGRPALSTVVGGVESVKVTQRNNLLIGNKQSRSVQIVGPGSQQLILPGEIRSYQSEIRVVAYVSTNEAPVPTRARISVCHNQHIPGLYETLISIAQI